MSRSSHDASETARPTRRAVLAAGLALPWASACRGGVEPVEPALRSARVTPRRSDERGHADHGWLDTYPTFSFASYRDPRFERFGNLRVLNQDRVQGGGGFPMHGHRDMEIVSWVLEGTMEHRDTMGNGSQIRPGDAQLMSAGHGVRHSEFNASPEQGLHFLQMWVFPERVGTEPRYEQKQFPREERAGRLRLIVSPDGAEGSLTIAQEARLSAASLRAGDEVRHAFREGQGGWLHVATGSLEVNGVRLRAGDGASLTDGPDLVLRAGEATETVLWEVPLA